MVKANRRGNSQPKQIRGCLLSVLHCGIGFQSFYAHSAKMVSAHVLLLTIHQRTHNDNQRESDFIDSITWFSNIGPTRRMSRAAKKQKSTSIFGLSVIAVGTAIAGRPPHRSVRAELLHTALTLDGDALRNARWDRDEVSAVSVASVCKVL